MEKPPCDVCSLFEIKSEANASMLIECKRLEKFYQIERHLCFYHSGDMFLQMKKPPRFEGVEVISIKSTFL